MIYLKLNKIDMTRQELELKAKEFDSKLKRHPMSSEELQKVLCDFVETLSQPIVSGSFSQKDMENFDAKTSREFKDLKMHEKVEMLCSDNVIDEAIKEEIMKLCKESYIKGSNDCYDILVRGK